MRIINRVRLGIGFFKTTAETATSLKEMDEGIYLIFSNKNPTIAFLNSAFQDPSRAFFDDEEWRRC